MRRQVQSLAKEINDLQHVWFFLGRKSTKLRKRLIRAPEQIQLRIANWKTAPPSYRVRIQSPVVGKRKRIVHVIGNFHIGGSARLVVDLVENLGAEYEQHVIVRELPDNPAYTGIPLTRVKRFKSPAAARQLLKSLNADLVHVHYLGHWNHAYSLFHWGWYRNVFEALEQYNAPVVQI